MKAQEMNQAPRKGFTLVELLVVVAIIAAVGAGIAVTYRHMDKYAKVAMEVSDISGIKKVIKHWSAVRDFNKIPDGFDLLVKEDGELRAMNGHPALAAGQTTPEVLNHLSKVGLTTGYVHLNTDPAIANDSTFTGQHVTTQTRRTLAPGGSALFTDAQNFQAEQAIRDAWNFNADPDDPGFDPDLDSPNPYSFVGGSITWTANNDAEMDAIEADVAGIIASPVADRLAFFVPTGTTGTRIVSNIGLTPDEIAYPVDGVLPTQAQALADGKKYYLVGMGIGRFTTLYEGRAVRLDGPPKGHRLTGKDKYSRYLVLIKVPVASAAEHGAGSAETAQLVEVLSPQALSVAALQDNLENEKADLAANN